MNEYLLCHNASICFVLELRLGSLFGLGLALGLGVLGVLDLKGRQGDFGALAAGHGLPEEEVGGQVPGEQADPGLDVVVELEGDVGVGNLARGVGDLVLGFLVLELEDAAARGERGCVVSTRDNVGTRQRGG